MAVPVHVVAVDLRERPTLERYTAIADALRALGELVELQPTVWLLASDRSDNDIRAAVEPVLGPDAGLMAAAIMSPAFVSPLTAIGWLFHVAGWVTT